MDNLDKFRPAYGPFVWNAIYRVLKDHTESLTPLKTGGPGDGDTRHGYSK